MGTGVLQTAAAVTVVTTAAAAAAAAAAAVALSRRGRLQQRRWPRLRSGLDAPLGRLRRRIVEVRSSFQGGGSDGDGDGDGDGSSGKAAAEAERSPLLQEQIMLQVSRRAMVASPVEEGERERERGVAREIINDGVNRGLDGICIWICRSQKGRGRRRKGNRMCSLR